MPPNPAFDNAVAPAFVAASPQRLLLPSSMDSRNLYCRELGRAYAALGHTVVFGADNLAEAGMSFDFVHLQWPEEHYRWRGQGAFEARGVRFVADLDRVKAAGARLIWTVHNLAPHENVEDALDRRIYQAVIDRADLIVHHCDASVAALGALYRVGAGVRHVVVPHGNYFAYPRGIAKAEARHRLGLPDDAFVMLAFGRVRAYKGLDLLLRAFALARVPRKRLLIAGVYRPAGGWSDRVRMAWVQYFKPGVRAFLHEVPDEDVQVHLAASDVVVLSHRAVLNSGVAVLGMSFGKPVIGPRAGCLPAVIAGDYNVLYEPGDPLALAMAMERSSRIDPAGAEAANMAAAARWDWRDIAQQVMAAATR
jgi:beta-1,4-mannosyltransferase